VHGEVAQNLSLVLSSNDKLGKYELIFGLRPKQARERRKMQNYPTTI